VTSGGSDLGTLLVPGIRAFSRLPVPQSVLEQLGRYRPQ
jgi:hypothetical protein